MDMKNIIGMLMKKKIWTAFCMVVFAAAVAISLSGCNSGSDTETFTDDIPVAQEDSAVPSGDDVSVDMGDNEIAIEVPSDSDADTDDMVFINVENMGRANPFMPPNESDLLAAVPKDTLKYDVLPPLEQPEADENARKVITTKVSGIMYDKIRPSAILNVDGSDYLVRSGDVLNGYKVLSIEKSVVTVQMGANVYKAGVGELIAEGKDGITYNQVANLSSKFGGAKK